MASVNTSNSSNKKKELSWKKVAVSSDLFANNKVEGFVGLEVIDPKEFWANAIVDKKRKPQKSTVEEVASEETPAQPAKKVKQPQKEAKSSKKQPKSVPNDAKEESKGKKQSRNETKSAPLPKAPQEAEKKVLSEEKDDTSAKPVRLPLWNNFGLDESLLKGISQLGFKEPTPIQRATLLAGIRDRKDIVGAAETGSGKTLAFGLPILQNILSSRQKENLDEEKHLRGLILTPTRELAVQIYKHLKLVAKYTGIKIVPIIGGISIQKQQRVLNSKPDIIVATPGRLWELMEDSLSSYITNISRLEYLVLDEADRMIETGHYRELTSILQALPISKKKAAEMKEQKERLEKLRAKRQNRKDRRKKQEEEEENDNDNDDDNNNIDHEEDDDENIMEDGEFDDEEEGEEEDDMDDELMMGQDEEDHDQEQEVDSQDEDQDENDLESGEEDQEIDLNQQQLQVDDLEDMDEVFSREIELEASEHITPRQTFVFSATLTTKPGQIKKLKKQTTTLDTLMEKIDFHRKIEIVDLTRKEVLAEKIRETKIECLVEEKDYYLYYLLSLYKGRTLVFVNAISCIKRMVEILAVLKFKVFALHANMQQKQRLTNLERFAQGTNSILIATDVAARGLDIPQVDHVIHYQLPKSAEVYVHRSGRTARANQEGITTLFVDPKDRFALNKISFGLSKDSSDIPPLVIDQRCMPAVKERIRLARMLDKELHQERKLKKHDDWLIQSANQAGMEIDEDLLKKKKKHAMNEEEEYADQARRNRIKKLRKELNALLEQPLFKHTTAVKTDPLLKDKARSDAKQSASAAQVDKITLPFLLVKERYRGNPAPKAQKGQKKRR